VLKLTQTAAPSIDPVARADAKNHLKVDFTDDDSLIDLYISAATSVAEKHTWRQLITATYELSLNDFPDADGPITIPRPPLQSIVSITYTDTDGNSQTLSASKYQVDTIREPGQVWPETTESWPAVEDERINAVTVKFKAGYGDNESDVPQQIRHAIKRITAHIYDNREDITVSPGFSGEIKIPRPALFLLDHFHVRNFV